LLSAPLHELHYPWGAAPHPGLPETTARSYCRACAAPLPPATAPAARRPATALSAAPQRTPAPRRQLASVMQAQAHHTITAVAGTASGTRNLSSCAPWWQLEPPNFAAAPARETAAAQPETEHCRHPDTVSLEGPRRLRARPHVCSGAYGIKTNCATVVGAALSCLPPDLPAIPRRRHLRRRRAQPGCSRRTALSSASNRLQPLPRALSAPRAMPTGRPCPRAPSAWR
jgi:hypothetical protein